MTTFRCPSCDSRKNRWQGYHYSQRNGRRHRRVCNNKKCRRSWYPKPKTSEPILSDPQSNLGGN